jgi:hypothetical protein
MPNPLVSQGSLNLAQASVFVTNNPSLNVTPSFLAPAGIDLTLEGRATEYLGTMTGAVTSPNIYMMASVVIHLLRTLSLSDAYKTAMEFDSRIGPIVVRPDLSAGVGLEPYDLDNCAITGVRPLNFAGKDPGFIIEMMAVYAVNSNIFNG